jgi:WD40 repeat protein
MRIRDLCLFVRPLSRLAYVLDGSINVQLRRNIATLSGHGNSVTSVSFDSTGQKLATCSQDKTVKIWRKAANVGAWKTMPHAPWGSGQATTNHVARDHSFTFLWRLGSMTTDVGKQASAALGRLVLSAVVRRLILSLNPHLQGSWGFLVSIDHSLNGHMGYVYSVAFGAGGIVATGSEDRCEESKRFCHFPRIFHVHLRSLSPVCNSSLPSASPSSQAPSCTRRAIEAHVHTLVEPIILQTSPRDLTPRCQEREGLVCEPGWGQAPLFGRR